MKTSKQTTPHTPHTSLPPEVIDELAETNNKLVVKNKQVAVYEDLLKIKAERTQQSTALRPLFFHIGMAISLMMVIVAINWKSYEHGALVDLGQIQPDMNEIIEIPISKQPPPPPPKTEIFKIEEVKDSEMVEELEISLDVEVTVDEAVEQIDIASPDMEEEVVEEIFVIVEQEPTPKGGIEGFYTYLAEEINYPSSALRLGVSGSVYVQFVIEKDGSITQAQVVKGIGAGCDEEALRVLNAAPPWNPGKQRGLPVRVKKIIPIRFILAKK